jgi:hypothetical protein
LFDIGKVVLGLKASVRITRTRLEGYEDTYVAVHRQATNLAQGIVLVRPHLGHVENVPLVRLRLLGVHDLDEDVPLGVVALLDSLEEILGEEVRVLTRNLGGGLGVEVLDAFLGLEVELDVLEATILFISNQG